MAEYIERTEELILAVNAGARVIENTKRYHGSSYCIDVFADDHKEIPYLKAAEVLRGFDEIPAADVAPVVHGEWVSLTDCANAGVYCSVCHKKVYKEDYAWCNKKNKVRSNYCPNCGAHMKDGE
jgi:hypothetical protein